MRSTIEAALSAQRLKAETSSLPERHQWAMSARFHSGCGAAWVSVRCFSGRTQQRSTRGFYSLRFSRLTFSVRLAGTRAQARQLAIFAFRFWRLCGSRLRPYAFRSKLPRHLVRSTTGSPSYAKPTLPSKPSRRRCSSRGSSISIPSAPSSKAWRRPAWTKPRRPCFLMGSRSRRWGWCPLAGGSVPWATFPSTRVTGRSRRTALYVPRTRRSTPHAEGHVR